VEELAGYGKFYMVPDLRRLVDRKLDDVFPMIVTVLTEESGVTQVLDAREDLSRLYPWLGAEAWDPVKIAASYTDGAKALSGFERGYWWSLLGEPDPFHDGAGLLRILTPVAPNGDAWAVISSQMKADLRDDRHFFALRYPGRRGDVEWLFVVMVREKQGSLEQLVIQREQEKRRAFEKSIVYGMQVHSVRPSELRLRNSGVVGKAMAQKTVALIGLGALGSVVAELLAKAGVGRFRLCDSDRLATGNVARHIGGLSDFGALKTRVAAARLLEINPYLQFGEGDVISGSAVGNLEDLATFLDPADLTIVTTADESVESVINEIAVLHRKTVLYGRALRQGSMGRVFLVRPGRDACKACLSEYARATRRGEAKPSDWIDVPETEEDVLLHECGRPVIPASAIDLSFVAALIARVCLDVLEGKTADSNHWLWSQSPAPDVDPRLAQGLYTFIGRLERRFGCPACQEPGVVQLIITESAQADITSITESSPAAETGGVLIGFIDEQCRAVVVRVTGPGPRAERSRSRFSRDIEYVQAELVRAQQELGSRGMYIGEWHSHLEAKPQPSPTDIESLFGVAAAPHYLTRCPAMIIAGLDAGTGKVAALGSWAFPVEGRVHEIVHETLSSGSVATLREKSVN
jgi:integrative and conjugative element protein (TIGR02256 family)